MSAQQLTPPPIVPREKLDFGLDGDIPKFWLDNDPFKTRFFDAMSTLFPVGEKFFITCVRDGGEPITTGRSMRRPLELVLAAYESMRTNREVELPLA